MSQKDPTTPDRSELEQQRADDDHPLATPPAVAAPRVPGAERRVGRRIDCDARGVAKQSPHGPGARRG